MTTIRIPVRALAAVLLAAATGTAALAHGVGWERESPDRVVALRFVYSDGEPMLFAEVTITDPEGKVFQKARSDREGRFAFVPARDGEWRAKADDGGGHALEAHVTVVNGAPSPDVAAVHTTAVVDLPRPVAVLLGLSLIANLSGAALLWARRRKETAAPVSG